MTTRRSPAAARSLNFTGYFVSLSLAQRAAPHVLDGLLYHETGLQIVEHYTDTGGATGSRLWTMRRCSAFALRPDCATSKTEGYTCCLVRQCPQCCSHLLAGRSMPATSSSIGMSCCVWRRRSVPGQ